MIKMFQCKGGVKSPFQKNLSVLSLSETQVNKYGDQGKRIKISTEFFATV